MHTHSSICIIRNPLGALGRIRSDPVTKKNKKKNKDGERGDDDEDRPDPRRISLISVISRASHRKYYKLAACHHRGGQDGLIAWISHTLPVTKLTSRPLAYATTGDHISARLRVVDGNFQYAYAPCVRASAVKLAVFWIIKVICIKPMYFNCQLSLLPVVYRTKMMVQSICHFS